MFRLQAGRKHHCNTPALRGVARHHGPHVPRSRRATPPGNTVYARTWYENTRCQVRVSSSHTPTLTQTATRNEHDPNRHYIFEQAIYIYISQKRNTKTFRRHSDKGVSYAARFRASDLWFSIRTMKASASAVRMCTIRQFFFDLRIRWPKSSNVAQNPTTWAIRLSNRKMAWSLNSICYPRQQAAAERSMIRTVTKLHDDVASRPTRSRRAARLSVARRHSAGAGSIKTKRSALGAHLSVDIYS